MNQGYEKNPNLASEIINSAGPEYIYHRPGCDIEVSNVTRVVKSAHGPSSSFVYRINNDNDPVHIIRQVEPVSQKQPIRIRYLEPPNPPTPAPIIIKEKQQTPVPPAPPILIRQHIRAPPTPPPLVIR